MMFAVLSCGATIQAATLPAAPQFTTVSDGEGQYQYQYMQHGPEAEMLREAYFILARANNNYNGHRVKAMKEIEEAGELAGMHLKVEGSGHERQVVSDAELRHARELLERVRDSSMGSRRFHRHVRAAIKEVSLALSIK